MLFLGKPILWVDHYWLDKMNKYSCDKKIRVETARAAGASMNSQHEKIIIADEKKVALCCLYLCTRCRPHRIPLILPRVFSHPAVTV